MEEDKYPANYITSVIFRDVHRDIQFTFGTCIFLKKIINYYKKNYT